MKNLSNIDYSVFYKSSDCEEGTYFLDEDCHPCHCKDTEEICNKFGGSCMSGCLEWYVSANCNKREY